MMMVMVTAVMVVVLSKGGGGKQQGERKDDKLLHAPIVASRPDLRSAKISKELAQTVPLALSLPAPGVAESERTPFHPRESL